LSTAVRHQGKKLGIEDPPPVHGLRKCAVSRLVEAGLDVSEINAITGQSPEIIRHYARDYDRDRLVDRAVIKLDRSPKG
jgi:integrase